MENNSNREGNDNLSGTTSSLSSIKDPNRGIIDLEFKDKTIKSFINVDVAEVI